MNTYNEILKKRDKVYYLIGEITNIRTANHELAIKLALERKELLNEYKFLTLLLKQLDKGSELNEIHNNKSKR